MRNQYGRGLRSLISNEYAIDLILPMHDVDAFEAQVSAYPAVVILRNGALGSVALGEANAAFQPAGAAAFTAWAHGTDEHLSATGVTGTRLAKWTGGDASWPGGDPEMVAIIEQLNERFELLGTRTPAPASALAWPPEPTSSLSPPNTILSKATAFYR